MGGPPSSQPSTAALLSRAQHLRSEVGVNPRVAVDVIDAVGQLGKQLDVDAVRCGREAPGANHGFLIERIDSARREFTALQAYCMSLVQALHVVGMTIDGRGTAGERLGTIAQYLEDEAVLHISHVDGLITAGQQSVKLFQKVWQPPPAPREMAKEAALSGNDLGSSGGAAAAERGVPDSLCEDDGDHPRWAPPGTGADGAAVPSPRRLGTPGGPTRDEADRSVGQAKDAREAPSRRPGAESDRSADRPPARFPPFLADPARRSGPRIAELRGPGAAEEAQRLAAASRPFVWHDSGLAPAQQPWSPAQLAVLLRRQTLDTNLSSRADRKFVYFSPPRLEKGAYEPSAVSRDFMPMRLNESMSLEEVRERHAAQVTGALPSLRPPGPARPCGGPSGWARPESVASGSECAFVMQALLEGLSPGDADRVLQLPPSLRPPMARLCGLDGDPAAIWRPGLDPLASVFAHGVEWERVSDLASAGGWGPFETVGFMVSGRDALTPLHYDRHHNVFLQLHGAKRFLLFEAAESPKLYGFPTLHALDPLSRLDLEAGRDELVARWPRAAEARGVAATLEAGDVLVLPQGTWHHVQSLDPENVSASLLFSPGAGEACGRDGPGVRVGGLRPARRPAALAELAKTAEGFVGSLVGDAQAAAALGQAHATAAAALAGGRCTFAPQRRWPEAVAALGEFLRERLGDGRGGPLVMQPEEFVREYFDPLRFDGLPLRTAA